MRDRNGEQEENVMYIHSRPNTATKRAGGVGVRLDRDNPNNPSSPNSSPSSPNHVRLSKASLARHTERENNLNHSNMLILAENVVGNQDESHGNVVAHRIHPGGEGTSPDRERLNRTSSSNDFGSPILGKSHFNIALCSGNPFFS